MKNKIKAITVCDSQFVIAMVEMQDNGGKDFPSPFVVDSETEKLRLSPGMKSSLDVMDSPKSISIMTDDQIQAQGLKVLET